jgi:hypothetical protein
MCKIVHERGYNFINSGNIQIQIISVVVENIHFRENYIFLIKRFNQVILLGLRDKQEIQVNREYK